MKNTHNFLCLSLAAITLCALSLSYTVYGQDVYQPREIPVIDPGTTIEVRTIEPIDARDSDGHVFSGAVAQDIFDRHHNLTIQKASDVELVIRRTPAGDLALDFDSLMINGHRYALQTEDDVTSSAKYVGGPIVGAIIGAISGVGPIEAGETLPASDVAQLQVKGRRIEVPANSLLTFRLAEPLRPGVVDHGYTKDGMHYHHGYGTGEEIYRAKPSIR
jgi:hypothetical protein